MIGLSWSIVFLNKLSKLITAIVYKHNNYYLCMAICQLFQFLSALMKIQKNNPGQLLVRDLSFNRPSVFSHKKNG